MRRTISLPCMTALKNSIVLGLFFIVWLHSYTAFSANQESVFEKTLVTGELNKEGNAEFKSGFKKYLLKDYSGAYEQWIKSAKSGHKESLFNIGKMWLDGLVPNESVDLKKARVYFKRAARKGYAPANQFLSNPIKANATVPEQSTVAVNTVKENDADQQVIRQEISEKPETIKPRFNGDNSWLNSYGPNQWVIQIFASRELLAVQSFILENNIQTASRILKETINGKIWYKLLYGQYSSRATAVEGRKNLPKSLRLHKPWLRKVSTFKPNS